MDTAAMTFNSQHFSNLQSPVCRFTTEQKNPSSLQLPPVPEVVTMETICSLLTADPAYNIALLFHFGPTYLGCERLSYATTEECAASQSSQESIPLSIGEAECILNIEGLTDTTSAEKKKAFSTLLLQQERSSKRISMLKNIEDYNTVLFDNCPDGLIVSDSAGAIVDANRTFVRMCGISRDRLIGLEAHSLMADRYQNVAIETLKDSLMKGRARFKGRLKLPTNAELPIRVATQTFDFHGETLLFSVVREFRSLDEKIWRFEQYTRSLAHSFDQADDVYLTSSDSGEILETNPAFFRLFKVPASSDNLEPLHEFVCANSLSLFRKSLAAVAATGHAAFSAYLQRTDGTTFPARVSLLRFQHDERQAYRCIIQRTDEWELPKTD